MWQSLDVTVLAAIIDSKNLLFVFSCMRLMYWVTVHVWFINTEVLIAMLRPSDICSANLSTVFEGGESLAHLLLNYKAKAPLCWLLLMHIAYMNFLQSPPITALDDSLRVLLRTLAWVSPSLGAQLITHLSMKSIITTLW